MLFIEMRKRRVIKKAYKWLHKRFPNNSFLVYWQPHADGFFVDLNDEALSDSDEFAKFAFHMRFKLFHRAGFSVWFGWAKINGKYEHVYNAAVQEEKEAVSAQS